MENGAPLRALLVADGSGGHLIPALEVAAALAKHGVQSRVWYAQRHTTRPLTDALTREAQRAAVEVDPIPIAPSSNRLGRLWRCGQLWQRAERCFTSFAPDVVVGFGGWVSAPVILAARSRRIGCLVHEQNVNLGRANRWLARWVDRVAVSFGEPAARRNGTPAVMTGLPVRTRIGRVSRADGAARLGLRADRPTLLALGGSQGARALNRLMVEIAGRFSPEERRTWQLIHLTGPSDDAEVRAAYTAHEVTAWVGPFLVEMEAAYALADIALARAGGSTIAELARCGIPSILIPYPHAGAHQRTNARLVEASGGGLMLEELDASPERLVSAVRRLLGDERLRRMMGMQMRTLSRADATERLTDAIVDVARARRGAPPW